MGLDPWTTWAAQRQWNSAHGSAGFVRGLGNGRWVQVQLACPLRGGKDGPAQGERRPMSLPNAAAVVSGAVLETLGGGTRLGTHEIVVSLGAGGVGEVYHAKDLCLGHEVTLELGAYEAREAMALRGLCRHGYAGRAMCARHADAPGNLPDPPPSVVTPAAMATAGRVAIHVPGALRDCCGGAAELSISAASVRAALEAIEDRHPTLYRSICDETGAVRRHVNLFVNTSNVRDREGLDTALSPGDVVTILPAVSGGRACRSA
jgi:molybdopterin converting factor small subunit